MCPAIIVFHDIYHYMVVIYLWSVADDLRAWSSPSGDHRALLKCYPYGRLLLSAGVHITSCSWAHNPNLMAMSLGYSEISHDQIMSQLCTCHDSWAVMACANLWPDMNITCLVKLCIFLYGLPHKFINCSWTGFLDSRAPERSGVPIGTLAHTIILLMIFPYGMLPSSYSYSYRWMWEFLSISHEIYTQFPVHCFLLVILEHLSRFVTIYLPMIFRVMWVGVGGFSKVVVTFNHVGGSFTLFMANTGDVWVIPSFRIWG